MYMVLAKTDKENSAVHVPLVRVNFNSVKYHKKSKPVDNTHILRHKVDKETQFPIYSSLLIHSDTHKKVLIDTICSYGFGIS